MKKAIIHYCFTFAVAVLAACSSNSSDAVTYEITAETPTTKPDKEATPPAKIAQAGSSHIAIDDKQGDHNSAPYLMGVKHAKELAQCASDSSRLNDCLLDINARITNISSRIGEDASKEYLRGMRDYLRDNNAPLADLLF